MRQAVRRGVAPLNTNPKWPEGYMAVLREAGAQEKTIPFFVTWVRRFFARFPGRSRRSLGRVEIETFLGEMARRNEISNWGVAQARDALELYYEQFRGIALATRPDNMVSTQPPAPSSRPPRQLDEPITGPDRSLHETSLPYQAQQAAVKRDVRGSNSSPAIIPRSAAAKACRPPVTGQPMAAPMHGPVTGKTDWRLLEARVREHLRVGHYSYRTEQTYLGWIRRFVAFHQGQKPSTMDAGHVRDFLRHLATKTGRSLLPENSILSN